MSIDNNISRRSSTPSTEHSSSSEIHSPSSQEASLKSKIQNIVEKLSSFVVDFLEEARNAVGVAAFFAALLTVPVSVILLSFHGVMGMLTAAMLGAAIFLGVSQASSAT